MQRSRFFWLRIILLLLLSILATYGAFNLILAPDGHKLGLSIDWLKASGFHDYLLPGLILFLLIITSCHSFYFYQEKTKLFLLDKLTGRYSYYLAMYSASYQQ